MSLLSTTIVPYRDSTDLLIDPDALRSDYKENGYIFMRGLFCQDRIENAHRRILEVLKKHGFVKPDADGMIWSGKWPEKGELNPDGKANHGDIEHDTKRRLRTIRPRGAARPLSVAAPASR